MALAVQIDNGPNPLELTQFAPLIKIYTKIEFPKKMNSPNHDSLSEIDKAFHQELDRRLSILAPEGQDVPPLGAFNRVDYILMLLFGLLVPALAMFWGWR